MGDILHVKYWVGEHLFSEAYPRWQIKDKLQIYEDATQAGGSYEHCRKGSG
jgi:hypothetical protein